VYTSAAEWYKEITAEVIELLHFNESAILLVQLCTYLEIKERITSVEYNINTDVFDSCDPVLYFYTSNTSGW